MKLNEEKQELYSKIAKIANIEGNVDLNTPNTEYDVVYEFEPGSTPLPRLLGINYDSYKDTASVEIKTATSKFCTALKTQLQTHGITAISLFGEEECTLNFDRFSNNYRKFATALRDVIAPYRFFLPDLAKPYKFEDFSKEEYTFNTGSADENNICVWIPSYVCCGAKYQIDLTNVREYMWEDFREIHNYINNMIRIQDALTQNAILHSLEPTQDFPDITIPLHAGSEHQVRNDLETIMRIVEGEYKKKKRR